MYQLGKYLYFCAISCVLLNLSIASRDYRKINPLQNILNDIFENYESKEPGQEFRRQLDLGPEKTQPGWSLNGPTTEHLKKDRENWTGRWFPDEVTETPPQSTSQTDGESWTGRWFPDDVTRPPPHSTSQTDRESWTGRWFPDDVTQPPPHSTSQTDRESWTGRWFPDDVTQPPPHSTSQTDRESWTGRWFPDDVTPPPPHSTSQTDRESWTGRWFPDDVTQPPPHSTSQTPKKWTGKWFPSPTTEIPRRKVDLNDLPTENNMWKMINSSCDDGKTNLTVDWPGSPINYTCFNPHQYLLPNYDIPSVIIKSLIPKAYRAKHECMNNEIHYISDLPTFGTHRPAWPRYGEYQFVPRQRWIHSLEHGAIVMLYHPCAHPQLVSELRELVTRCLFRHIITPYNLLPHDRPLALLSWGWALLMPTPDENGVKSFIRDHAKKGPEVISRDGQFSEGLTRPAAIISDTEDSNLCPPPVLF